jgi:glycosyltransferase involved in cell wall biosynthesis
VTTSLDMVIPVLNEERDLPPNIGKLRDFLASQMSDYEWRIIIADNGSDDSTPEVSRRLSEQLPGVGYLRLEQRGRGLALRTAWSQSKADIVGYMDVDLSTDLGALPDMVKAIASEGFDVAVGSRLRKGSKVIGRSFKRSFFSHSYSLLFRAMFFTSFRDAQCGFKALSRRTVHDIVPLVKDNRFFFDTELLILAEKNGYRVKEVPVRWADDPDSRVRVFKTAYEDFKGLLRLRFGGLRRASRTLSSRRRS